MSDQIGLAEASAAAAGHVNRHLPLRTIPEAAKQLGLGVTTVERYVADGKLFSIKLGDRRHDPRRIPQSAIDDYVAARIEKAKAEDQAAPAGVRAPTGA